MSRRKACCAITCAILSDSFDRADSTNLGTDWQEVEGDWSISDSNLTEAGTTDAVVATTATAHDESMVVQVQLLVEEGKVYRILVNYRDESNYHYVELDGTTVELWKFGGGMPLASMSAGLGEDASVKVCFDKYGTFAADLDGQIVYACTTPISGGTKAGLGNGSTSAVTYQSFVFLNHHLNKEDEVCEWCVCTCNWQCVPDELTLTIYDKDGCSGIDGTEIKLYLNPSIPTDKSSMTWKPNPSPWVCGSCEFDFELQCNQGAEHACTEWTLYNDPGNPCGQADADINASNCTCDPLYLEFQFYTVVYEGGGGCCTEEPYHFYVVVTE